MNLVLRAYDHETVLRAEALPVQRLWTVLESGGMRDAAKERAGLTAQADVWARETVVSRLEALVQEGYGDLYLARLRSAEPPDHQTLRRPHWPPIETQEAVDLREDLVCYLTYGLWQAPEESVAHALGALTNQPDIWFLLGSATATPSLQAVLDAVEDDTAFAARFGQAVRMALAARHKRVSDADVQRELGSYQNLLGPVSRLLRAAGQVGLRVIAYQDSQGEEWKPAASDRAGILPPLRGPSQSGLTRFLKTDMGLGDEPVWSQEAKNGKTLS